jgi:hypothetical protein
MKISVCGKGGSGKSTIVSLLAHQSAARGFTTLVVDADESNAGLFYLLGFTAPLTPLMNLVGGRSRLAEKMRSSSLLSSSRISADDIPASHSIRRNGMQRVSVGQIRHALEGCAWPILISVSCAVSWSSKILKQRPIEEVRPFAAARIGFVPVALCIRQTVKTRYAVRVNGEMANERRCPMYALIYDEHDPKKPLKKVLSVHKSRFNAEKALEKRMRRLGKRVWECYARIVWTEKRVRTNDWISSKDFDTWREGDDIPLGERYSDSD